MRWLKLQLKRLGRRGFKQTTQVTTIKYKEQLSKALEGYVNLDQILNLTHKKLQANFKINTQELSTKFKIS